MENSWKKIEPSDLYVAMQNMTPAERFLEVEKSRVELAKGHERLLEEKEQEIIECLKATITDYIVEYQGAYGKHYREELAENKAHCWIAENDEFLGLIKDYMELLYD